MEVFNPAALKNHADRQLEKAGSAKTILLIYAGILLGSSALITVINYLLDLRIDQSGGLSNMGLKTMLSTIQSVLPIIQMFALLCLEGGYIAAVLRIARGQYVSPQTLRAGLPRFSALLRCYLLQSAIYAGAIVAGFYLALQVYLLTPLSQPVVAILEPIASEITSPQAAMMLEESVQLQLMEAMTPLFIVAGLICLSLCVPLFFQYRLCHYILMDDPKAGARYALRESRKRMRGNKLHLLRLDLSFWWYYALTLVLTAVGYADTLLPMVGVSLPVSPEAAYFLCYGIFLAGSFVLYYFFLNRVNVAYADFHDCLCPKQKPDNGVVLGNIFQM